MPADKSLQDTMSLMPNSSLLLNYRNYSVYQVRFHHESDFLSQLSAVRQKCFCSYGVEAFHNSSVDDYDFKCDHLLIWDRSSQQVIAGCRLNTVKCDRDTEAEDFYMKSLYHLTDDFISYIGTSLEVSRMFVKIEQQRQILPFKLLWTSIYHYFASQGEYNSMIGSVSIDRSYSNRSLLEMIEYLKQYHSDDLLLSMARSVRQSECLPIQNFPCKDRPRSESLKALNRIVRKIENGKKGIPPLLKFYFSIGAKFVSYCLDDKFSESLDILIVLVPDRSFKDKLSPYIVTPSAT